MLDKQRDLAFYSKSSGRSPTKDTQSDSELVEIRRRIIELEIENEELKINKAQDQAE